MHPTLTWINGKKSNKKVKLSVPFGNRPSLTISTPFNEIKGVETVWGKMWHKAVLLSHLCHCVIPLLTLVVSACFSSGRQQPAMPSSACSLEFASSLETPWPTRALWRSRPPKSYQVPALSSYKAAQARLWLSGHLSSLMSWLSIALHKREHIDNVWPCVTFCSHRNM